MSSSIMEEIGLCLELIGAGAWTWTRGVVSFNSFNNSARRPAPPLNQPVINPACGGYRTRLNGASPPIIMCLEGIKLGSERLFQVRNNSHDYDSAVVSIIFLQSAVGERFKKLTRHNKAQRATQYHSIHYVNEQLHHERLPKTCTITRNQLIQHGPAG